MRTDNQIVSRGIYTGAMVLILVWLSGCASYRTNTDLKFGLFETVEIPSDFLIIKGDLVDIPYTHVGPVKAIVKKLSMFHDDPTKAQADLVLYHQAAAIGADAVIWVWYESGESWDSWGYLKAEGLAVRTQRGADDEERAKEEIQTYPQFVDMASKEIDSKKYDKVLWVRALSLAEGDVEKQKDIYIKLRSSQLASQAAKVSPWGTPDRSIQIASEKEKAELNIAMQPCIEHARSTFPETLKRYQSGRFQGTAFFVIVLSDQKTTNYIIVENFEDGQIRGRVEAQGITFKGRYYPQGSMIDLGAADIFDWYVLYPDRPPEGNLLGRYLLMRMDGLTREACDPAHREFQHYRFFARDYSFVPPGTDGWEMRGPKEGTDMSLHNEGKSPDELNTLSSFRYKMPEIELMQDLIAKLKTHMEYPPESADRYTVLEHQVDAFTNKEAMCALSQQVIDDKKALLMSKKRVPMIREVRTLLCLHPYEKNTGVMLNYSHRYYSGNRDVEFKDKANKVFQSLAFTKMDVQLSPADESVSKKAKKPIEPPNLEDFTTAMISEKPEDKPSSDARYTEFSGTYNSKITGDIKKHMKSNVPIVKLVQEGDKITGTYGDSEGKIWGDIEGNTIKFDWTSSVGPGYGTGKWTFNPESGEFTGTWFTTSLGSGEWSLFRRDVDAEGSSYANISGTYRSDITSNTGYMFRHSKHKNLIINLKQDGSTITGTDQLVGSEINGTLEGDTIKFNFWSKKMNLAIDVNGEWKIIGDGSRLEGFWGMPGTPSSGGKWNLIRIE